MDKKCEFCNNMMFNVRSDKKFCSRSCQAKASRKRKAEGIDISKKICPKCMKEFIIEDNGWARRYCYDCIPKNGYNNGAEMRHIIKEWALDYKGKQCYYCGYNICNEALDFHHLDQNEKDFNISDRDIKLDWEQIKNELDKCILVCANCHREIHAGIQKEKVGDE